MRLNKVTAFGTRAQIDKTMLDFKLGTVFHNDDGKGYFIQSCSMEMGRNGYVELHLIFSDGSEALIIERKAEEPK